MNQTEESARRRTLNQPRPMRQCQSCKELVWSDQGHYWSLETDEDRNRLIFHDDCDSGIPPRDRINGMARPLSHDWDNPPVGEDVIKRDHH